MGEIEGREENLQEDARFSPVITMGPPGQRVFPACGHGFRVIVSE